ncbi:MAG: zinc-dependent dehydrogenase [Clostridiales bacterium]
MKAAVLYGPGDLRIEEVAKPQVDPESVLIKIDSVGLCGSDIRTIGFGHHRIKYPQILGHEITGMVVEIGGAVEGYALGERVYVSPIVPCLKCRACQKNWYSQCENFTVPGTTIPGGFAEYMLLPKSILERGQVIKIPEGMTYEQAVMTEPLSSVYAAQENADVKLGNIVVVIGLGPIGCMHIQTAKLRGAVKVIAIEVLDSRLELAKSFGADEVINSNNADPVSEVKRLTDGWGADVIISANPSTLAQRQAIEMAAKRGKVVFFGGVKKGALTEIDSNIVHYNQLMIIGHYGYDHIDNFNSFQLIATKKFEVDQYITHVLPLEEIHKGVELTQRGEAIKVILKP